MPCPHPIKVFNTDFIEANLKWDIQIEPILLIGEENIKLEKELIELRDQQERISSCDSGLLAAIFRRSLSQWIP